MASWKQQPRIIAFNYLHVCWMCSEVLQQKVAPPEEWKQTLITVLYKKSDHKLPETIGLYLYFLSCTNFLRRSFVLALDLFWMVRNLLTRQGLEVGLVWMIIYWQWWCCLRRWRNSIYLYGCARWISAARLIPSAIHVYGLLWYPKVFLENMLKF